LSPSISLRTGFAKHLWLLLGCAAKENDPRFFASLRMTRIES
jgi:hypothetical protein